MITVAGAIEFASRLHKEQKDWTGQPYINRLLAVRDALHDPADDDDAAQIAGVLSGVLKDTDTPIAALERLEVPPQVIEALKAVTKEPNERYVSMVHRANAHPLGRKVLTAMVAADLSEERLKTLDLGSADFLRSRRIEALSILTGGRRAA